jgi:hypothetical protein
LRQLNTIYTPYFIFVYIFTFDVLCCCTIIADSESPVSFPQEEKPPPERRLSAELRRVSSLRNPTRPSLLSTMTRQITLSSSKSSSNFDPTSLAQIIGDLEDELEGKLQFPGDLCESFSVTHMR